MTLAEFKAWFEGFTEGMDDAPTPKQWKRIKARVAEINGQAITERVYIDRYIDRYRYLTQPSFTISAGSCQGVVGNAVALNAQNTTFDSGTAMMALGRADRETLDAA